MDRSGIPDVHIVDALMRAALDEARRASDHDDVPIGAVVARVADGEVVARRHNERELRSDPTAHAELLAIRDAATAVGTSHLDGYLLVSTVEPCPMCGGAVVLARLDAVVFGTPDPKAGAMGSLYHLGADPRLNHEVRVAEGPHGDECAALLRAFFDTRR